MRCRLPTPGVARLDRMGADMDQMGLRHRCPEDLVGPSLPRISVDDEARERIEERECEPEELREVPHRGLGQAHRAAQRSDLEAADELAYRRARDRFGERRIAKQHHASSDPVHPGGPNAFEVEERPERREDRDEVEEERDHAFQPMDLERAVMPEQVETAHHERIPESDWASRY